MSLDETVRAFLQSLSCGPTPSGENKKAEAAPVKATPIKASPVKAAAVKSVTKAAVRPEVSLRVISHNSGKNCSAAYQLKTVVGGKEHVKESTVTKEQSTNNEVALAGLVDAVRALKVPCAITASVNNKYVADNINNGNVRVWRTNNWHNANNRIPCNLSSWVNLVSACAKGGHSLKVIYEK